MNRWPQLSLTRRACTHLQRLPLVDNADSCSVEPEKRTRCLDRQTSGCHLRSLDHARAGTEPTHASSDEPIIALRSDLM